MVTTDRFIGKPEASKLTSLAPSTLLRLEKAGKFPKRRKLSPGRVGYRLSEVMEYLEMIAAS